MKIENSFAVPLPPAEAWRVLLDIERMARCLPGAELTEKIDPDTYKGKVAVRLGPVALSFAGTAQFVEIDAAARRARVKAKGIESKGRGGAEASTEFALAEAGPGSTRVNVVTDLALNGAVAQYGRGAGMIAGVAQQLIDQFATTLKVELEGSAGERDSAQAEARRGASIITLIFGALWAAIKRLVTTRAKGATS
jgi:carbon monoxide dehydrogenase subunit G